MLRSIRQYSQCFPSARANAHTLISNRIRVSNQRPSDLKSRNFPLGQHDYYIILLSSYHFFLDTLRKTCIHKIFCPSVLIVNFFHIIFGPNWSFGNRCGSMTCLIYRRFTYGRIIRLSPYEDLLRLAGIKVIRFENWLFGLFFFRVNGFLNNVTMELGYILHQVISSAGGRAHGADQQIGHGLYGLTLVTNGCCWD